MSEGPKSAVAAQCACADCRQYRLWRAEGTDEWQPDGDRWNVRSAPAEAYAADATATGEAEAVESLSSH
jgi:hypothetical protein